MVLKPLPVGFAPQNSAVGVSVASLRTTTVSPIVLMSLMTQVCNSPVARPPRIEPARYYERC